jgi:hypothetical protein
MAAPIEPCNIDANVLCSLMCAFSICAKRFNRKSSAVTVPSQYIISIADVTMNGDCRIMGAHLIPGELCQICTYPWVFRDARVSLFVLR